jgi:hypothetical protein
MEEAQEFVYQLLHPSTLSLLLLNIVTSVLQWTAVTKVTA